MSGIAPPPHVFPPVFPPIFQRHARDSFTQAGLAFSLRFCILQAIKNWRLERPGNEASCSLPELPNAEKKGRFTKLEVSVNLKKPLDDSRHLHEAQGVHTVPIGKLRNTHHKFIEVLAFLRWSVLWFCLTSLLHSKKEMSLGDEDSALSYWFAAL